MIYDQLSKGLYKIQPAQNVPGAYEISPEMIGDGSLLSVVAQNVGNLQNGKTTFDNSVIGYILGVDGDVAKFYIGDSSNYLNWTGTALVISGTLSAGAIDIGGADATSFHVDSSGNLWMGAALFADGVFKVSNAGALTATSATITGAITASAGSSIGTGYLDGTVGLSNTNIAAQGWTNTCVFSATDYRVVAWASGAITTAGGTTYNITGANTGNMTASTSYFIYLDIAVSTTLLQTTTTAATAVGAGKILVATAYANSDTTSKAQFQVFGGVGGQRIFVDNISANSASTNEFISNSAQLANLVVTNAKINDLAVDKLSAGSITSKAITLAVSAGTGDVKIQAGKTDFGQETTVGFILGIDDSDSDTPKLEITGGLITSGIIQSAASGQRIRLLSASGTTPTQSANSIGLIDDSNNLVWDVGSTAGRYMNLTAYASQPALNIQSGSNVTFSDTLIAFDIQKTDSTGTTLSLGNAGSGYALNIGSGGINFGSTRIDNFLHSFTATAGENIAARDAVMIASGNMICNTISQTTQDANAQSFTSNQFAQTFTTSANTIKIISVVLKLIRVGIFGGNFNVGLYATSGGVPTGDSLGGVNMNPFDVGDVSDNNLYTFTFATPITVSPSTVYAIVFTYGGGSGAAYLAWYYKGSDVYAGGSYCSSTDSGSTWTADTNKDFYFKVNEGYHTAGRIYKTNATKDDELATNFIGIAPSAITSGNTGLVAMNGKVGGFSSLTIGSPYYLSTTSGLISTTKTFPRSIGFAISATEIELKTIYQEALTTTASDELKQSADTENSAQGNTYTLSKSIKVLHSGTIRVTFDLKTSIAGRTTYGKIYINGVAVGTQQSSDIVTYTNYSEDIAVSAGDLIQLYTKCINTASEYAYVRNFRLSYTRGITSSDIVITD